VAAVQQPWYVWVENVSNLLVIKEGKVWQAVEAMARLAGYHLSWSDE
jgi:site-specific DNA-cytosine methylase